MKFKERKGKYGGEFRGRKESGKNMQLHDHLKNKNFKGLKN